MAVVIVNRDEIPADLPPGSYCTRLDESSRPDEIRVRFVMPPRKHTRHDCLITVDKAADDTEGE